MCECLTWHHPAWRAAAKLARTQPDTVFAIFCALDGDGAAASRLTPAILAAGLGRRVTVVLRILASLASLGVTCDGVVTQAWRRDLPDVDDRGLSMRPSAVRMRRKRAVDRAGRFSAPGPLRASDPAPSQAVTCDAPPSSFSFFQDQPEQQEQKPTRAPEASDAGDAREAGEDGFAALRALWPITNRMGEAEADYRRYRRRYSAAEILAAAQRYLDTKEEWRNPMFLMNWLRTDPCRDPQLPLGSAPRAVATGPPLVTPASPSQQIDWDAYARSVGWASNAERLAAMRRPKGATNG